MAAIGFVRQAVSASQILLRKGAVLGLVLVIAACSAVYRNHGYAPSDQDLALVEVGVDTKDTVGQKLGRPSASGLLTDDGWFYVQSRFRQFGPREAQEIERQVVVVTYDESGTVENIARYGLEDGQVVEISRRVTSTNIKPLGLIRQLLGSLGRINPAGLIN